MKTNPSIPFLAVVVAAGLMGCGPSKAERDAQEHARLELEERQRRETEAANKAITGMNQKLGRKPPALDLNLAPTGLPTPTPEKSNQP